MGTPDTEKFKALELNDEDDYMFEEEPDALLHENAKPIVKEFLLQVKENRFPEFPWPPDDECPQYKHGFISDHVKNIKFKKNCKAEESERAKRFLDQVRRSWGYDVDCHAPSWMEAYLFPIDMQSEDDAIFFGDQVMTAATCVVDRINTHAHAEKMGTFKFVRLNNVVAVNRAFFLLTLTIMHVEANANISLRAAVAIPPPCHDPEVIECNRIPSLPT